MQWLEPAEFYAWRQRLNAHRRLRQLTAAHCEILAALLALVAAGQPIVTDAHLAAITDYSTRTVRRARARATELGLLHATRQRRLVAGQWRQGANSYRIELPAELVCPAGQPGRARKQALERKEESRPTAAERRFAALRNAIPPALTADRLARFHAEWQARRPPLPTRPASHPD